MIFPHSSAPTVIACLVTLLVLQVQAQTNLTAGNSATPSLPAQISTLEKDIQGQGRTNALLALDDTRNQLALLETKITAIKKANPNFTGDLAQPDLQLWRSKLDSAQNASTAGLSAQVANTAGKVKNQVDSALKSIADYQANRDLVQNSLERLKRLSFSDQALSAKAELFKAEEDLRLAQSSYLRGDSGYLPLVQAAQGEMNAAVKILTAAETHAATARKLKLSIVSGFFILSFLLFLAVRLRKYRAQ
jgi:hypothetical protein